jgi:hypothetical protein
MYEFSDAETGESGHLRAVNPAYDGSFGALLDLDAGRMTVFVDGVEVTPPCPFEFPKNLAYRASVFVHDGRVESDAMPSC